MTSLATSCRELSSITVPTSSQASPSLAQRDGDLTVVGQLVENGLQAANQGDANVGQHVAQCGNVNDIVAFSAGQILNGHVLSLFVGGIGNDSIEQFLVVGQFDALIEGQGGIFLQAKDRGLSTELALGVLSVDMSNGLAALTGALVLGEADLGVGKGVAQSLGLIIGVGVAAGAGVGGVATLSAGGGGHNGLMSVASGGNLVLSDGDITTDSALLAVGQTGCGASSFLAGDGLYVMVGTQVGTTVIALVVLGLLIGVTGSNNGLGIGVRRIVCTSVSLVAALGTGGILGISQLILVAGGHNSLGIGVATGTGVSDVTISVTSDTLRVSHLVVVARGATGIGHSVSCVAIVALGSLSAVSCTGSITVGNIVGKAVTGSRDLITLLSVTTGIRVTNIGSVAGLSTGRSSHFTFGVFISVVITATSQNPGVGVAIGLFVDVGLISIL